MGDADPHGASSNADGEQEGRLGGAKSLAIGMGRGLAKKQK